MFCRSVISWGRAEVAKSDLGSRLTAGMPGLAMFSPATGCIKSRVEESLTRRRGAASTVPCVSASSSSQKHTTLKYLGETVCQT